MDTQILIAFLQESIYMISILMVFFVFSFIKGRQSITNIILGLYFALLISIQFPYYGLFLSGVSDPKTESIVILIVFAFFTVGGTWLFSRLMPRDYDERPHEAMAKKLILSLAATVLVMTFSYHALPVTDLITPGSPINYLFGSEGSFFWWLLAPIGVLFFVK